MAPTHWAQLGPPILLDRPERRARWTPDKAGRPASGHGLRPGRRDHKPQTPAPPPENSLRRRQSAARGQPWLRRLPRRRPLAAPAPIPPNTPGLPCGGRAAGRAVPAGAAAARNRRNGPALGGPGGVPRPGPPTCSAQFPAPGAAPSRGALGSWGLAGSQRAPGAPASSPLPPHPPPLPTSWDPRGGGTGSKSPGLGYCKFDIDSEPQAWSPLRGGASEVLRASASPRGPQPRDAAVRASLLPFPGGRWFRSCPP